MKSDFTTVTTVGAGGRVEVRAPDLSEGQLVEVTVRASNGREERRTAVEILGGCRGGVLFRTAEDVSRHLDSERSTWDR